MWNRISVTELENVVQTKSDPKRDKDESRVFGLERSRFEHVTVGVHWPWHCSKNVNKMKCE